MRQTARVISTYAADPSGVCSALYELGGMSVIHDASGCNSTYNTHDEPRWYEIDSLVFISAITEMEAIMGDDEKLVEDLIDACENLKPKFMAVCGTPIPMMIGTDLEGIARRVEDATGVISFGIPTNGMHSYIEGVSKAFTGLAGRILEPGKPEKGTCSCGCMPAGKKVNVLGLTPLDFSVNGSASDIVKYLNDNGWEVVSSWAMGSTLEDLKRSGEADVNLVVSYAGYELAKMMKELYGIPAVYGVPMGEAFGRAVLDAMEASMADGQDRRAYENRKTGRDVTIIGESIYAESVASLLSERYGMGCRVICPLETSGHLLLSGDVEALDEDDIIPELTSEDNVMADPLYKPILPQGAGFRSFPSEGFSGRMFRNDIPNLIGASGDNVPLSDK